MQTPRKRHFCKPSLSVLLIVILLQSLIFHWFSWYSSLTRNDDVAHNTTTDIVMHRIPEPRKTSKKPLETKTKKEKHHNVSTNLAQSQDKHQANYHENATIHVTSHHITTTDALFQEEDISVVIQRRSKANSYKPFDPFIIPKRIRQNETEATGGADNRTVERLLAMGVNRSDLTDSVIEYLPSWSQVISNYGEEPIVLGLERCKAFRKAVLPKDRMVAPAGLFSTGTNLLDELLTLNCKSPIKQRTHKQHRLFNPWQVLWGKHNPNSARFQHAAPSHHMIERNQSAILPVVMVRHPYTWLYALCQHPYSLKWKHRLSHCHDSLFLDEKVHANWGAKRAVQRPIQTDYDSLIHVWRDWNLEYFHDQKYPVLFARLEDLVYRPEPVIRQICECAGGRMIGDEFVYQTTDSVNRGYGHGEHRSDLLTAFVKFGLPLSLFEKNMFRDSDWEIIRETLNNDDEMMEVFGY